MSVHPRLIPRVARGPGRVAAVIAQRGGEVDRLSPAEHADDQAAQAGHDLQGGTGADLGGVLGKGHVPDPVQAVLESLRRLRLWVVNKWGSSRWWGGRACSAWSPRWNG
jgi:hypothetical protein